MHNDDYAHDFANANACLTTGCYSLSELGFRFLGRGGVVGFHSDRSYKEFQRRLSGQWFRQQWGWMVGNAN
jgi:hypothetical protein